MSQENELFAMMDKLIYDRNATFDAEDLKVGDTIRLIWVKRYQHGATMKITKVNKKSFKAEEIQGSYGGPREGRKATVWTIHKKTNYVMPVVGSDGRTRDVFPNHYDHSR